VRKPESEDGTAAESVKLSHARAYSIALAPQLLYTRSTLLSSLVSSQTHNQLEFQAVGSWFILNTTLGTSPAQASLTRVPGGREDVFKDGALDLKSKRSLMKFLRFVAASESQPETWHADRSMIFSTFLEQKFALPPNSHAPIFALTLSNQSAEHTTVEFAVPRIARHLTSIGLFGPGFGAVLPKWGGLAEVGQVACRACAVGGGVYVLGQGINDCRTDEDGSLKVKLSAGDEVSARWLAGTQQDLPASSSSERSDGKLISKSVSIISSPLIALFPPTCEGGPVPAGAVAMVPSSNDSEPPVYIFAHSSESGECPAEQCVLYATVAQSSEAGFHRLDEAVKALLASLEEPRLPDVLWALRYQQRFGSTPAPPASSGSTIVLDPLSSELALEDTVLLNVVAAWQQICGADAGSESFMKFEARDGAADEESFA